MKLTHTVHFAFDLSLAQREAVAFVQDAQQSLSKASFIRNLEVAQVEGVQVEGVQVDGAQINGVAGEQRVKASIPINAALFGQHDLSFQSVLIPNVKGARLEPLIPDEPKMGWAEVAGEADVRPLPSGSHVEYHFDITIHLDLPQPEKWGGQALLKMIHFTAQRVLEGIAAEFPKAVQDAAAETEAAYSRAR